MDTIVQATSVGQVDTLLVAEGAVQWGEVDSQTGVVAASQPNAANAEELVNLAVVRIFIHGGGGVFAAARSVRS